MVEILRTIFEHGLYPVLLAERNMKKPSGANPRIYTNPALPAARRVKDLLSHMTLEEKAAQMICVWQEKARKLVDADGNFDVQKAQAAFKDGHGIGQVGRPSDAGKGKDARGMAELTNAIQKFFVQNSRLGIPVIFHEECLHGHAGIGSTSFPQPIGLAATFNPGSRRSALHHDRRERRAFAAPTRHSRRWWTWRATRAGAGSRKPSARIPIWSRNWASPRSAGFRATHRSATKSASSPP